MARRRRAGWGAGFDKPMARRTSFKGFATKTDMCEFREQQAREEAGWDPDDYRSLTRPGVGKAEDDDKSTS